MITGFGPKTFENCAGFVRIFNGSEILDTTNVHPESYTVARWLLQQKDTQFGSWLTLLEQRRRQQQQQQQQRDTNDDDDDDDDDAAMYAKILQRLPHRDEWDVEWKDIINEAGKRYEVSSHRVLTVLEQLVDALGNEDPRLKLLHNDSNNSNNNSREGNSNSSSASTGLIKSCKRLPPELSTIHQLANAINNTTEVSSSGSSGAIGEEGIEETVVDGVNIIPIRGVIGTIRNVADFGAFIDIGNENNGLMHKSKMGPTLRLHNLLIGQQIGIDILSVTSTSTTTGGNNNNHRISLGLHGCNYQPPPPPSKSSSLSSSQGQGQRSSSSYSSSSSRKHRNTTSNNNTGTFNKSKKRSISTKASSSSSSTTIRRTKQKR